MQSDTVSNSCVQRGCLRKCGKGSLVGWLCIFYGTAKFCNCLKNCIQIWLLLKCIEENSCLTTIEKYFQLLQVFLTRKVLCEFFVGLFGWFVKP